MRPVPTRALKVRKRPNGRGQLASLLEGSVGTGPLGHRMPTDEERKGRDVVDRSRRVRRAQSSGAVAVEFALVLTFVLLPIVIGIINYGMVYDDSNNARAGAREAVRRAVVLDFGSACTGTDTEKLKCLTKSSVGALSGDTYVAVKAPASWSKGQRLRVCVMIKPTKLIGFIPTPQSIRSSTSMSVEATTPAPTVTTSADTLPTPLTWPTTCT